MAAESPIAKGETIGAWLPVDLLRVFRRHVGSAQGAAGRFAVEAIREKLERDGAYSAEPSAQAQALLKEIKPESLPLVIVFVELLSARGPAAMQAKLRELSLETVASEAGA